MNGTRIFSGVMPVGGLHLGNVLSGVWTWRRLLHREDTDCTFMVADLEAAALGQPVPTTTVRATLRQLVAAGIDPDRCTLFVQGDLPEHPSAAYLLGLMYGPDQLAATGYFGQLRTRPDDDRLTAALLGYPLLQAADLLLHAADEVPAGDDEAEFLAFSADVASRLNRRGLDWRPPKARIQGVGRMVMDLLEPHRPMSKLTGSGGVVWLDDDAGTVERKFALAAGVAEGTPVDEQVVRRNLLTVLELLGVPDLSRNAQSVRDLASRCADEVNAALTPAREALRHLDGDQIDSLRSQGASRARAVAGPRWGELAAALTRSR